MTEDKKHKDNFLKISRSLNRNNRYNDMLPCINIYITVRPTQCGIDK